MQTFTILIEKDLNLAWKAILVKNFGSPIDQKKCGKKFTFRDKCEGSGVFYITLYHTNKILLQAEGNSHVMNIHFINEHLETLYTQVYKFKPTVTVHGLKVPDEKMTNSPTLRARSKSVSINCKTGDSEALDSINLTNPLLKHNENLAVLPPGSKIDEELPFICSICDCSALSLESLNTHKLNNHSQDFSAL